MKMRRKRERERERNREEGKRWGEERDNNYEHR
jgi:hypothetical protein